MSKIGKDDATTALANPASAALAPSNRDAAFYDDESSFQEIKTEFNFWKPLLVTKDSKGMVVTQELCTLRGIPLVVRERQPRADDTMIRRDANGRPIPQFYMVIVLTAPCRVTTHDKEIKEAMPGEMVWADQRHALTIMNDYLPQRPKLANGQYDISAPPEKVHEVIIRPTGQRDIPGGKKVWNFTLKTRGIVKSALDSKISLLPPATPEALPVSEDASGAELPF